MVFFDRNISSPPRRCKLMVMVCVSFALAWGCCSGSGSRCVIKVAHNAQDQRAVKFERSGINLGPSASCRDCEFVVWTLGVGHSAGGTLRKFALVHRWFFAKSVTFLPWFTVGFFTTVDSGNPLSFRDARVVRTRAISFRDTRLGSTRAIKETTCTARRI